jgi:hypothetical protein
VTRITTITLLAAAAMGCGPPLEPGEFGIFRYAGNVRGAAPLDLLPPISDRYGNTYVLFGGPDRLEVELFIGYRGGTWDGGCTAYTQTPAKPGSMTKPFGAHGFVGRAQDRAWYWAGEALVGASGTFGGCVKLLTNDPNSGAKLAFKAVVPFVRETPSKTTLVAWVQSPTDPRPFAVLVDLDAEVFRAVNEVGPATIGNVTVLGTGANHDDGSGVVVMRYELGATAMTPGTPHVEARFYDADGIETGRTALAGFEDMGEYDIRGFLQPGNNDLWVGLDKSGGIVALNRSQGARKKLGFAATGVHRWERDLFVVGTDGGAPVVAAVDGSGGVGAPQRWQSSQDAANALNGAIDVLDDRTLPSRHITWQSPRTATGAFPFLHGHSLHRYGDATTLWMIAGPSFKAGGEDRTAIAIAPVGIAYP